jgi:hypothetical protein
MALMLIDGFDLYPAITGNAGMNTVWTFNSTSSMALDPGRFGGQAIRSSQDRFITSPTFALTANVAVGFAFKASGFPGGSEEICRLMSASGDQVIVGVNGSRQLIACRGSISTVLGTSIETLGIGIWHYIEIEAAIDDASGLIGVWLDGVQVIDLSGVDTRQQAEAGVDRIRFQLNGLTQFSSPTVDDVYVTDSAARLGESRVAVLYPVADTADADWTPSAGADHYALVDETTVNSDSDYVASGSAGALDLYEVGDLPFTPESIHAVQVTMCARKDDAATREVRSKVKSGATSADGAVHAMAASYQYFRDIHETDPDTTAAWTSDGVNALQIGPEVVT